ncbi:MAG TPA: PPK2 family polyphosphate kinase [Solirubrobacteraceae bacterium]|jgi:PPK2 family polyphosphate:nucleotide phosphotransferase
MIDRMRVEPGSKADIAGRDARDTLGIADKAAGRKRLAKVHEKLWDLQARLYAEARHSVLLVLQGLDASGKDGVIRTVFTGLNPQGCRVSSFKAPTSAELARDYLWRVHAAVPARGEIGIFNRSHYEDVVTVGLLKLMPKNVWSRRPEHIREWERMLTDEGAAIVKVFLNVSKEEQRVRLQERVDDPAKRWKFRIEDLDVRKRFDEHVAAWEAAINETSTDYAPWYVVPADRNWVKSLGVAELLLDALQRVDPQMPPAAEGIEGLQVQ